jgi:hypothetical protein
MIGFWCEEREDSTYRMINDVFFPCTPTCTLPICLSSKWESDDKQITEQAMLA